MEISNENIEALRGLICGEPKKIVILTHTNPDGDAIGSSLAWGAMLEAIGHDVTCIVPNKYPYFLSWMPEISKIKIFRDEHQKLCPVIQHAEIIFSLDFNQVCRLEGMSDAIKENTKAKYVLIDHHLDPPKLFDISFSHPESSSTAFLVFNLIKEIAGADSITKEMAENLYVGIMTDTGNFSYSNLSPDLFRAVAVLVEKGVDIPYLNQQIYNSFTIDRVKLLGYAISKMETMNICHNQVAYMTLTEAELRKFKFQQGDSEGFVNYPLTIKGLTMSAIFIETRHFIRVSLRSRGDVDVSKFANLYFEGGGHKNAAGGKSYRNMEQTIQHYRRSVEDFFSNHYTCKCEE